MPGETKHGIECTEFETLLSDALEGELSPARKESFEAHRRVCPIFGAVFAEVEAGGELLRALAVEPGQAPATLVPHNLAGSRGVRRPRPPGGGERGPTS